MHILFVTGEYPPMRGGVGAYTACLADALQAHGAMVSVLTNHEALTDLHPHTPAAIQQFGRNRWGPALWHEVPRLAQQCQADWVHVQYQTAAFAMNPSINLAPRLWRWRNRRTNSFHIAWTYHDLLVPYLFPKAGTGLRRWVTALPAHASDLTIVTNEADRQQLLAEQALSAVKIPIGSNIAPPQLAPGARLVRRKARGYSEEQLLLGYFGFLNRSKGGLTLIHTLARLVEQGHDAHLLMIGERVGASDPTNFAYLQEVEALIEAAGLGKRVQWTDHQEDHEVSMDLAAIDVLLMPYLDGASLRRGTLMAGLAHGCAIVTTTPQTPLPELVDGQDLCFVPPNDPAATAAAVCQLIADSALRRAMEQHAQAKSHQFTWEAIAQSHLLHYQARMDSQGARS